MARPALMSSLERHPYVSLAIGVLAVSSAAIWVRLSHLPAPVLAFYRLAFSAAGVWVVALLARAKAARRVGAQALQAPPGWPRWAALAGVSLAAHWAVWFASLERTSVLSSTVLVTTQPLWVVLLAWLLWRQRVGRLQAVALAVALAGGVVIALADAVGQAQAGGAVELAAAGRQSVYGDLLALLAAALVSVYLLVGQHLRATTPLVDYLAVVYTSGAAALFLVNAALRLPVWGWPWREVWVGLGLAAIPTLIGHSALNLVVARLGASTVATAVLGEPVGASILALVLFRELPGVLHWAGSAMILAGIYLFTTTGRTQARGEGAHADASS